MMTNSSPDPREITVNGLRYPAAGLRLLNLHADFACANNGFCCVDQWNILLSGVEYDRVRCALIGKGWTAEAVAGLVTPVRRPGGKDGFIPRRSASGGCIFHETGEWGGRCLIHHQAGPAALPGVCQSFPRLAIATPAGVRLTLSCTCPTAARALLREGAVAETHPRSVCSGRPELLGLAVPKTQLAPRLTDGCHPTWGAFDAFWRWTPEWLSAPGMSPSQALWGLGRVMELLEANGRIVREHAAMVEALDTLLTELPTPLAGEAAQFGPVTELGVIYFDTLMICLRAVKQLPPAWERAWQMLHGPDAPGQGALCEAYDRLIRPGLAAAVTIECNFIAARLYANPHACRAGRMRTGYFLAIMELIALRFSALMLCLEEKLTLDESVWLRAAGLTDYLLLHNHKTEDGFIKVIEPHLDCPIQDLARAALF